jgi:osmotically-inducible protein OsmY
MRTILTVTSALVILGVAVLYASTGSHERVITEVKEDVRDTSRALAVKAALIEHFGRDAINIDVVVDENVASLSGEVEKRSTMELSEEVTKSLERITVVHNFLSHSASDVDSVSDLVTHAELEMRDAVLETKVKTELVTDVGDAALAISVEACDGVVSLRGALPDKERRAVAVRTARSLPNVVKVIDLLQVTS